MSQSSKKLKVKRPLRRGKWTIEEERYVERVIRDFNSGLLAAAPGTTLRNYLSDKLNCDPMRITKKFTGDASIGKRVFHPREGEASDPEVLRARCEVAALEATWRSRLERQARDSAAAVSSSAAASPSSADKRGEDIEEGAHEQLETWLRRSRSALNDATTASAIDRIVADGRALHAEISADANSQRSASSRRALDEDDLEFSRIDEEATSLLVEFLRSAHRQRVERYAEPSASAAANDDRDDENDDDDGGSSVDDAPLPPPSSLADHLDVTRAARGQER